MTATTPETPATQPAMRVYEISNPSDTLTIEAGSDLVAGAAVLLLGSGRYGLLRGEDGSTAMPIFFFGGHDVWLAERGVADLSAWLRVNGLLVAAALESVLYGSPQARAELAEVLAPVPAELRPTLVAEWNDRRRSSLNNIGKSAEALAKRLREIVAEELAAAASNVSTDPNAEAAHAS